MTNQFISKFSISLFRFMLSLIFIVAGANHLLHTAFVYNKLQQAPFAEAAHLFGNPHYLILISGVAMVTGGLSLAAGFQTRLAAIGLLACLLPITLIVQLGSMAALGPLFKNIAIAGGLLFFIVHPAAGYTLDTGLRYAVRKNYKY
jgi:putative oxidoreductase